MSNGKKIGGIISLKIDGIRRRAKGVFTYNLGRPKREMVAGVDEVHGYTETPVVPFVAGIITDGSDMKADDIINITDKDISLDLANGKSVVLRAASYAGDADITTEAGEIPVRFEGFTADEIPAA